MDIEIFLNGTPSGEDHWGIAKPGTYFDNFYKESDDPIKLLIQIPKSKDKLYCYYNYLIYNDIIQSNGRSTGYFALTIRLDAYCKDFMLIYSILDTVFRTHILNNVIEQYKGKLKYMVSSFTDAEDVLKKAYDVIVVLLQNGIKGNMVCDITDFKTSNQTPSNNIFEVNNQQVEDVIRQYGQISMSPYFPSSKEKRLEQRYNEDMENATKECQARIENAISQKDQEVQNLSSDLKSIQSDCNQLSQQLSEKEQECKNLKSDINKLQEVLKTERTNKNVAQMITQIKEPLTTLAQLFGNNIPSAHKAPETPPQNKKVKAQHQQRQEPDAYTEDKYQQDSIPHKPYKVTLIKLGALAINILLSIVAILLLLFGKSNGDTEEIKNLNQQIELLQEENTQLKDELNKSSESEVSSSDKFGTNVTPVTIDIKNNYSGSLGINQTYEVEAKGSKDESGADWSKSTGCDITPQKGSNIVTIKPTSDQVHIEYKNTKAQKGFRDLIAN